MLSLDRSIGLMKLRFIRALNPHKTSLPNFSCEPQLCGTHRPPALDGSRSDHLQWHCPARSPMIAWSREVGSNTEALMVRFVSILAVVYTLAHGSCAQAQLTLLRSFSTELTIPRGPDGIAYHPDSEQLYVVDSSSGSLFSLTMDGELIETKEY